MKALSPLLLASTLLLACSTDPNSVSGASLGPLQKSAPKLIAFGSCNDHEDSQAHWDDIAALSPELWIWLGDNIYGDSKNPAVLQRKYTELKNDQYYHRFRENVPIIGTWDDHDYGIGDGGKEHPTKKESSEAFFEFLDIPEEKRADEGVYQSYTFGRKPQIKIYLLDARYFRDAQKKRRGKYVSSKRGTILGKDQWNWLIKEMKSSKADINIICSGIQVIPDEHPYEKWANFPKERTRLLESIVDTKLRNPIIISGDRHIAELSSISVRGQEILELTASGLTHSYEELQKEPNRRRLGDFYNQKNFGSISIEDDWSSYQLQIRQIDGTVHQEISRKLR